LGKLTLSIVLLILIVAVSYIQAVRRQTKVDNSFQLGIKASQKDVLELKSATDSIKTLMGDLEVKHGESLLVRDKIFQKNVDSLSKIITVQEKSIIELKKKGKTDKPSTSQNQIDFERRHRELLAYYKKRYEALPADLTECERKVAISEIRQETAGKYSITSSEFNRIRELYELTY